MNDHHPLLPTPNSSDHKGGNTVRGRVRDGRERKDGDRDLPQAVADLTEQPPERQEDMLTLLPEPMSDGRLFAVSPVRSPDPVGMHLLGGPDAVEQAMLCGVYAAAQDLLKGYGSPYSLVYEVTAAGPVFTGKAYAKDAPQEWGWAHPAVEDRPGGRDER
jgi:hypothetical protein